MAVLKKIKKPKDVNVDFGNDGLVTVSGPKGVLRQEIPSNSHTIINVKEESIELSIDQNKIKEEKEIKRILGLYSSLISNMVTGVSKGFKKSLQIIGVGFKVANNIPRVMELELGFSHAILFVLPNGIDYDITEAKNSGEGLIVSIKGIDKYLVGQVAGLIHNLRPVEPYKGKGIRYISDVIKLKEKKAAK